MFAAVIPLELLQRFIARLQGIIYTPYKGFSDFQVVARWTWLVCS